MNNNIISERKQYYNDLTNQFNIYYSCKNKEVVFMNRLENWKCIRGLKIKKIEDLQFYFRCYQSVIDEDENIYISLANYKNIPTFPNKLKGRSKFTAEWFDNSYKDIFAYDLLLDFDYDDKFTRQNYYNEIKLIYDLLLNFGIKFYMIFSGNNYQIIIDSCVHNQTFESKENLIIKNWIHRIKEVFNLNHLDLKGAGVHNKIFKCPYSLVENRIIFPIKKFNLMPKESYEIKNIKNKFDLKNRGVLYNNYNISYQYDRFLTLIDKYNLNKCTESLNKNNESLNDIELNLNDDDDDLYDFIEDIEND